MPLMPDASSVPVGDLMTFAPENSCEGMSVKLGWTEVIEFAPR